MDKREVTSSQSRDYMEKSGKGLTNSMDLRTKSPNKKQKERFSITDITNLVFQEVAKGV